MKKIKITAAGICLTTILHAQNIKDANVYPSNLEENMWFEKYDKTSGQISGINFLVLADGDNSKDVTPEFSIKLYLYQKGQDPIFIKTLHLKGLYHMGSKEYKNISVSLKDKDIPAGTYRLGVYVDADDQIKEDAGDNAILFKGDIVIGEADSDKQKETGTNDGWGW